MDKESIVISKILHDARIKQGWSMREAARQLGVTHTAIRKWEDGITNPSAPTFIRALKLYGIRNWEEIFDTDYAKVEIEDE